MMHHQATSFWEKSVKTNKRSYGLKGVSHRIALRVDLMKAFDSVNWDFLMQVLVVILSELIDDGAKGGDFEYHLQIKVKFTLQVLAHSW
ncbi:hypothetical protein LINPERHAP1_LOCUS21499 [Linum perenne]